MTHIGRGNAPVGLSTAAIVTKHLFVTLDASECSAVLTAVEIAGAGALIIGISADTSIAGGTVGVYMQDGDIRTLTVDGNAGAIAVGDRLKSDAAGKGVKTTTDTNEIGAIALAASTGATDKIPVMITKGTLAG